MNNPFFSIVIPTFNRVRELERAINCILLNDFNDFEIIIADNNSKDKTEQLIKNLKNTKITYFKNKRNIGWIPSMKKGLKIAKGKYVILHGDDDFIINPHTLKNAYTTLKNHNFGFLRLNFLRLSYNKKRIFDNFKDIYKDETIAPKQNSKNIIEFLAKSEMHFISGIIYKNYKNAYKDIVISQSVPWFRILFKNVNNYGGLVLSKHSFIGQWSRSPSYYHYDLLNGKLTFEPYFNEVSKVVDKKYYKDFLKNELKVKVQLMPAAKLYTKNLQNFFNYSKRILYLSPEYKYSLIFWIYFFMALITPKFILKIFRSYNDSGYRSRKIPNYKKIVKRVRFLNQNTKEVYNVGSL